MFRPVSTRWLEVLCPREEAARALTELARTGALELELREGVATDSPLGELAGRLAVLEALYPRYGRYWARGTWHQARLIESPEVVVERALVCASDWSREADPLIDALQSCEEELQRLKWLSQVLGALAEQALDFAALNHAGPLLGAFCALLPGDAELDLPDAALMRQIPWGRERCVLILGPAAGLAELTRQVSLVKGRLIERPAWLRGDAREALGLIQARRVELSSRAIQLQAELDALFDDYDLGDVLGEVSGLSWLARHVGGLEPASQHLLWITGWTADLSGRALRAALERSGSHAILRLVPPPRGKQPPQILANPAWMRPFELFARALGVPGADEVDPTPMLAVLVPLLFGYMFGDLGQGAVLLMLGLWLRGRFLLARLLVSGGAAAMAFGLLYGSFFGREDILPALWLSPLHDPVTLLAVPVVAAVGLLSLGQMLAGVGARWRGDLRLWLMQDLGFLVLYLGLAAHLLVGGRLWLAALGALWYLVGAFLAHRRLLGALAALGHLLESGLQLLVNTLSFARVGAFALAHASLSAAICSMADAAPGWAWLLIMVLGNLLVIALEGLVVSIQTTRLVLFELFNRFLSGRGRVFRPLPTPPLVMQEST